MDGQADTEIEAAIAVSDIQSSMADFARQLLTRLKDCLKPSEWSAYLRRLKHKSYEVR
jgi:hypothetical protein